MQLLCAGVFLLSACGGSSPRPQTASIPIDKPSGAKFAERNTISPPAAVRGLDAIIGKDSATLTRMFGQPRLDVVEVVGRKLQFSGRACVLDAYLYPDGKNGAEVVTHIDARRSDGAEVDRVQCVNALMQR
jgi:hypothetical protein